MVRNGATRSVGSVMSHRAAVVSRVRGENAIGHCHGDTRRTVKCSAQSKTGSSVARECATVEIERRTGIIDRTAGPIRRGVVRKGASGQSGPGSRDKQCPSTPESILESDPIKGEGSGRREDAGAVTSADRDLICSGPVDCQLSGNGDLGRQKDDLSV